MLRRLRQASLRQLTSPLGSLGPSRGRDCAAGAPASDTAPAARHSCPLPPWRLGHTSRAHCATRAPQHREAMLAQEGPGWLHGRARMPGVCLRGPCPRSESAEGVGIAVIRGCLPSPPVTPHLSPPYLSPLLLSPLTSSPGAGATLHTGHVPLTRVNEVAISHYVPVFLRLPSFRNTAHQ